MKRVVVVGGGPAGLMAATRLLQTDSFEVIICDHKPALGRKFLVAGEGGFNLTHSEELPKFILKYDSQRVKDAVTQYDATAFRSFLSSIGIDTYIGSSGKVFPLEGIKPIQVLQAWLTVLNPRVEIRNNYKLVDLTQNALSFQTKNGTVEQLTYDFAIFALGGASWSVTGSDGMWQNLFREKGIGVVPFVASNSGVELSDDWKIYESGSILKNVRVCVDSTITAGDIVLTDYGMEGKPIYGVNQALRSAIIKSIFIDFKPQLSQEDLMKKLRQFDKVSAGLKAIKLPKPVQEWIKKFIKKDDFQDVEKISCILKNFEIPIKGFRPLDEVISTAGGVDEASLHKDASLVSFPSVFIAGEMLNWDAPTGGYLIQGSVATGFVAAQGIIDRCAAN